MKRISLIGSMVATVLLGMGRMQARAMGPVPPDPRCASADAEVRQKVAQIRSALAVYYSDTQGYYPKSLQELVPKYLSEIPSVFYCNQDNFLVQPESNLVTNVSGFEPTNTGGWAYIGDGPGTLNWGAVFPNSTWTSPRGFRWYSY